MKISSALDLRAAIERVVDYNWRDELNDYRECSDDDPEKNARAGHIFETLVALDNWVSGNDTPLAHYLP